MEVQVNESNGGLLSNTPPETRQIGREQGRASQTSEDTAHCSLWVTWKDAGGLYRTLAHAKAQAGGVLSRPVAKNAASSADNPLNPINEVGSVPEAAVVHGHQDSYAESEGLQPGEVEFGGVIWMVHPGGVKGGRGGLYYPYMLTAEGITLKLRDVDPDDKTPNLMAEMGSIPLAQRGGLEPLWAYLCEVITQAGGRIDKHRLSRVDVYTDLAGVHVAEFVQRFRDGWRVTRARAYAGYMDEMSESERGAGRQATGFSIGRNIMLRVYDKVKELLRDGLKWAVFMERYGGRLPNPLTRIEFQLRREALNRMVVASGETAIDTVADWMRHRADIWAYLTRDWFRLTDGPVDATNRHQERASTWPLWEAVADAANPGDNTPRLPVRLVERVGAVDLKQISRQSLATAAMWGVHMERALNTPRDFMRMVSEMAQREGWPAILEKIQRQQSRMRRRIRTPAQL